VPPTPKRLRRAKRARSKQRAPRAHDLRAQYRHGDLPATSRIEVMAIEDPYSEASRIDAEGNLDVTARLEQYQHADGTRAEGAAGWTPPRRPLVTVVANLREDPLGRLFARRQIGQPQFLAGREYQECHDAAIITAVRSVDLSKTKVSGGLPAEPLTERQRRAAAKVRSIEASVLRRYGDVGLWLVRLVLAERQPLEATARQAGATSARETSSVCWLFRKCLDTIAVATGFMSAVRRPYRSNGYELDPADDVGRQADEGDLMDPRLRSGRVNGG
jgi:hypothetical protein